MLEEHVVDVEDLELLLEDVVLGRALLIADAALDDALESTEERLDATLLLDKEDERKLRDALGLAAG